MNSMTGFGSGQAESPELGSIRMEMRSVNNRFLDVVVRLPQELSSLEALVRSRIQKRLSRGKVYLNIRFDPVPGATERYELNEPFLDRLEEFCRARGSEPRIETLLGIDGVVNVNVDESRLEELEALVAKALDGALSGMERERQREGDLLRNALRDIHSEMVARLGNVETARGQVVEKYQVRLKERIEELMGPQASSLDPGRIEQEVAIFADKADISEEVTRLDGHLGRLAEFLKPESKEAKGRALDFLAQEILREVNTIGSKARDLDMTHQVLELKNLVESLKEQIANVE